MNDEVVGNSGLGVVQKANTRCSALVRQKDTAQFQCIQRFLDNQVQGKCNNWIGTKILSVFR